MSLKPLSLVMLAAGAIALLAVARHPIEPRWQADDPDRGQHITAMTWWQDGPVIATQEGGVWRHADGEWIEGPDLPAEAHSTALLAGRGGLLAGTGDGVMRLLGNEWQAVDGDNTPTGRIAHLAGNGNRIHVTGRRGVWEYNGDAAQWRPLGQPDEDTWVYRVVNAARDGEPVLYSGSIGGGIHRYDPDGETWNAANEGLPEAVKVLSFEQLPSGTTLAGTDQGLYRRQGPDDAWDRATGLIGERRILSIAVTRDTLYIGSDDGVWKAPLGRTGAISNDADWVPVLALEGALDAPVASILTEGEQPWIAAGSAYRLRIEQPLEWYLLLIGGPLMLIAGGGLWLYRR